MERARHEPTRKRETMSTIKDKSLLSPTWTVRQVDPLNNVGLAPLDTFRVTASGKIERMRGKTPVGEWAHSCVVEGNLLTGLRSSDERPFCVQHDTEKGILTCHLSKTSSSPWPATGPRPGPIPNVESSATWVADDGRAGNGKLPVPHDLDAAAA